MNYCASHRSGITPLDWRPSKPRKERIIKPSRRAYEEWINEIPVPFDECKSNGGRIPDHCKYGTWIRKNDPVAFNVGFNEWSRENLELQNK